MRKSVMGLLFLASLTSAPAFAQVLEERLDDVPDGAVEAQVDPKTVAPVPEGSEPNAAARDLIENRRDQVRDNPGFNPATRQPRSGGVELNGNVGTQLEGDSGHASPRGDRWRYKQHNGHWWYWLPSNRWCFWHNNGWVNYDPQSYSSYYPSYGAGYSASGGGYSTYDDGNYDDSYQRRQYSGRGYYGQQNGYGYGNSYRHGTGYRGYSNGYGGNGYGNDYGGNGFGGRSSGAGIGAAIGGAIDGDRGASIGGAIGGAIDGGRLP